MGENRDAAIGLGIIAAIIAIIVGVVMVLLPSESETKQNELVKTQPTAIQEEQIGKQEEIVSELTSR